MGDTEDLLDDTEDLLGDTEDLLPSGWFGTENDPCREWGRSCSSDINPFKGVSALAALAALAPLAALAV